MRRKLIELRQSQFVVGLGCIRTVFAGPLHLRYFLLGFKNRVRACFGILFASMSQHRRQIGFVSRADFFKFGVIHQIHVTIREARTTLEDLEDVSLRILVILANIATEQGTHALGSKLGQ